MSPVVPAFSGFVPEGFKRVFPEARTFTELWVPEVPRHSKTLILDPRESSLYREIGGRFVREYRRSFGPVEYYLADTFNELQAPVTADHRYEDLARFGRTVYEGILAGDPNGKWVMQGWLFRSEPQFWDNKSVEALLSGIPNDRMIILDYSNDSNARAKEVDPTAGNVWKDQHAFSGKQWINGVLHTFGGNNNIKGNLSLIAAQPAAVLASPAKGDLVGWGMDPEGIENNEVVYELMTDIGWSKTKIEVESWIPAYCRARYGGYPAGMAEAWRLLLASAYSRHSFNTRHAWQCLPSLEPAALAVETGPAFRDAVEQFLSCADTLLAAELYRNDLIEFVSQSVGGSVDRRLLGACQAHKAGKAAQRDQMADEALRMLNRIDALMNIRPDRRLETWVADARSWGMTPDEQAYYDADARRLITSWGWPGLYDYASRVWSGLIRDYYAPRWREFFECLRTNRKPSLDIWEEAWLSSPWNPSPAEPVHDLAAECRAMLDICRGWDQRS
jgi:alpha-N-acetylglucosaminidase